MFGCKLAKDSKNNEESGFKALQSERNKNKWDAEMALKQIFLQ